MTQESLHSDARDVQVLLGSACHLSRFVVTEHRASAEGEHIQKDTDYLPQ